jgi:D-glycero-D-manno-heptose 1,7-bisphosphate phosphatase
LTGQYVCLPQRSRKRTIQACADRPVASIDEGESTPAIFLDRDGTLIHDYPYNGNPSKVELLPEVPIALHALRQNGYRLIVVTNQSGLARARFTFRDLCAVHARLDQLLAVHEVWIDAYYFCPHHVDGVVPRLSRPCRYRKPATGMFERAAAEWSIDLGQSWMIGDLPSDVEAGAKSGCQVIQVGKHRGRGAGRAAGLLDAASQVIRRVARASSIGAEWPRVARPA